MAGAARKRPQQPSIESGEAMCAVSAQYRVVGWNRAAEQLFGVPESQALGRSCFEVVAGKDAQAAPVCGRGCLPMQLATRRLPVAAIDLERNGLVGGTQTLTCTTLTSHANGGRASPVLFHLFHPNDDRPKLKVLLGELARIVNGRAAEPVASAPLAQPDARLTARELEVLRLVRQGLSTKDIASRLFVSPLTIHTHIQNIRGKLQVHNRLQAVAVAERSGLV